MKLLQTLPVYGYNVTDKKTPAGARIITITGRGAWGRVVFRPGCPLSLARLKVAYLRRCVQNLIQR